MDGHRKVSLLSIVLLFLPSTVRWPIAPQLAFSTPLPAYHLWVRHSSRGYFRHFVRLSGRWVCLRPGPHRPFKRFL